MIVLVFDLDTHAKFELINGGIRQQEPNVHAVWNDLKDLPTGDHSSSVDKIWYLGQVLSKLSDMVAGQVIDSDARLVYNSKNLLLVQAVKELLPNNETVDLEEYDSLYH